MRILYLSPWFPYPLDTGSRIRGYHLIRTLAQRHQVTLLTLDPHGWAPPAAETIEPLCERWSIIPRDPFRRGRLRRATRFFSLTPIVNAPFPEMTDLVGQLHAEQRFDVVIAGTAVMAPYALAASKAPHILEEHNSLTNWMYDRYQAQTSHVQRLRCWVSWRKAALYESGLFREFDLVTMTSKRDARTSQGLLSDAYHPIVVVPNGVDCGRFRPALAETQPDALIFGGALSYDANYEAMQFFLHDVYPRIRLQRPSVHLRITGSTEGVDLSSLPLDDSVVLTGHVDDIRPVLASAFVAIVPILSGGGTRIKILEAMALGTPVIATSKGAEGLEVVDGEHVLLADDPVEFADHTLRLLQDPVLRQRLATNARRLVEQQYDWNEIGQRFVSLVEEVASRRAERGLFSP